MFAPKISKPDGIQQTRGNLQAPRATARRGENSRSERTPAAGSSEPLAHGAAWNFSGVPAHGPAREHGPPRAVQAKLMIGQANDPLEHEADQAADQVMRGSPSPPELTGATQRLHGKCAACELEDDTDAMVQKKRADADTSGFGATSTAQAALRSPGRPLPAAERAFFEPRFGQDFSQVRVHTDDQAARSSARLGAAAYASGAHIVFGRGQYNPGLEDGRRLIAHELAHVLQQAGGAAPNVQRRTINSALFEDIQGLPMPNLLARLDTLPRAVLLDFEAGEEAGGPRLVLAMRAVRAKREHDSVGFTQANAVALQAMPPQQFMEIFTFLNQPEQSEREDFNFALEVPVVVAKPSDVRLRGAPAPTAEQPLDNSEVAEPISDFEAKILLDRSQILGAVLDPETGEIIGYRTPATTGLRRITDRNGATVFETEAPVESPLLDPIDFIPSPGAAAKVVTVGGKFALKAAAGIGGKIVLKEAAAAAAAKGAKTGSTLAMGIIFRLRQVSKAVSKPLSRVGGKASGKAVFGAGKTLLRPVTAQVVKASGPIDEALLEAAVKSRTKLVAAGVDWAKSNVATAKLLVNGKTVILAVDNPEWALHAEGAIMTEVRNLSASGKTVKVLQVFSERIPCGPGFANCMANLTQAFPTAEIFYGVSGAMNEGTTARALQVIYGLIK